MNSYLSRFSLIIFLLSNSPIFACSSLGKVGADDRSAKVAFDYGVEKFPEPMKNGVLSILRLNKAYADNERQLYLIYENWEGTQAQEARVKELFQDNSRIEKVWLEEYRILIPHVLAYLKSGSKLNLASETTLDGLAWSFGSKDAEFGQIWHKYNEAKSKLAELDRFILDGFEGITDKVVIESKTTIAENRMQLWKRLSEIK